MASGDLNSDQARFVTVTVPREQLVTAMAESLLADGTCQLMLIKMLLLGE